jgi:threonine synthase
MNDSHYYDATFFEYPWKSVGSFSSEEGLQRYRALLPNIEGDFITLGEGQTPLTETTCFAPYNLPNVWVKHEELNPLGSFKDRESALTISLARQHGVKEIVIASSGNAALSQAGYARKAGVQCTCFVPKHTTQEKKDLITLFGAKLEEIEGNYEHVYRYVADHYDRRKNVTAGLYPERVEANKTIAYEIWEAIEVPDVVVVPCGNGGNLAGIWRGFYDLLQIGKISQVPKMIGVQMAGAAPLKVAQESQKDFVIFPNTVDSLAEGILAEESYCSPKVMTVLRESNGSIVEVTEAEMKNAWQEMLEKESLVIEPTSAAAFAAVKKLPQLGVSAAARVVVISTGSGMKMLSELRSSLQ